MEYLHTMKKIQLIYTKSGNVYIYNYKYRTLLYIHPILKYIISKYNAGEKLDLDMLCHNMPMVPKKKIEYYINKFYYIKDNFCQEKEEKLTFLRYTPQIIEDLFKNSPQIVFEVTSYCNLKCKYCAYGELYNNVNYVKNNSLDFKKAKLLIDSFINYWKSKDYKYYNKIQYISFYGGEPLLNFELITQLVNYINKQTKNLNIKIQYTITTNGTLLDLFHKFLINNNFLILISLDGNETNNQYRVYKNGKTTFSKVFKNIEYLYQNYPVYFNKNISFNSVLHDKNSIEDIESFFISHFDKKPLIGEITDVDENNDSKEFIEQIRKKNNKPIDKTLINLENSPVVKILYGFLYHYSGIIYNDYTDLYFKKSKYIQTGTCKPFAKKVYLTSDGKILACERISHKFALGYITDKEMQINFTQIAEKYNRMLDNIKYKCASCSLNKMCQKCIFNIKDIENSNINCDYYAQKDKTANLFSQYISILEEDTNLFFNLVTSYFG